MPAIDAEKVLLATAAAYQVDLTNNLWKLYKPQLTACIIYHMRNCTWAEGVFMQSERSRSAFVSLCKKHLGGEFGAFVDETVRANRELTIQFLARMPISLMTTAHIVLLRPIAYLELCMRVRTWGFKEMDSDIVMEALKLKEKTGRAT
jgi:hypothetical protein